HEGGELFEIVCDALRDDKRPPRVDTRTRCDQTQKRNVAFASQLTGCTDSYLAWASSLGEDGLAEDNPTSPSEIVQDICIQSPFFQGHHSIPASLIRHGVIPGSVCVIPVQAVLDLHGFVSLNFGGGRPEVQSALNRDSASWRLRHACPCCTYKLEGEPQLHFDMLFAMDGNDSLKRVLRRRGRGGETDESGLGLVSEREDGRTPGGDYYLPREQVDLWAKDTIKGWLENPSNVEAIRAAELKTPCEDRWKNMASELTEKMWRMFDETGIFLALCRHGFVLVVLDMVQSGELSKYPLAVVKALLDAFGPNLGGGYDIGCQFETTISKSPLGPKAKSMNYKSLVGSFHGHAHNRLCQLKLLATYVKGMGLEDLETCERFFSRSNALASSIRHASVFHRMQRISGFLAHMDRYETYANLSTFLVNNYKQALDIIATEESLLSQMKAQGIADENVFSLWLKEEQEYLENLKREPQEETVKMEYWQSLVNYHASMKAEKEALKETFVVLTPENMASVKDATQRKETARRHAQEITRKDLLRVQELERKLEIKVRWKQRDPEWKAVEKLVKQRKYQRALDSLEGLVVSRMFELSKMNMSGTGYKLRKHIGNALKTRSQAIRNALERYNAAASALNPPKPHLAWDSVVEYAFLADFDLLSETRSDIRERAWAKAASRALLDQYFKIKRAQEEIQRLNVEIPRLVTFIRDEEALLLGKEKELLPHKPALAHQIRQKRLALEQLNDVHLRKLQKLSLLPGFTGSISPGVSRENGDAAAPLLRIASHSKDSSPEEEEDNEEAEEEVLRRVDEVCHALEAVVCV
ncbi:hypothetical protein BJ165DRAFT_1399313, partial [Panaeolus papilionaceus]